MNQHIRRRGILALATTCLVALGLWLALPGWRVVYEDEDPEQVASALAMLEAHAISYRLSDDHHVLSVRDHRAGEALIHLSAEDYLVGLEIIDFGPAPPRASQDDWYYQRALQGELTRSILQLDAVEACRVELLLPDLDPLQEEPGRASADILVRLRRGQGLSAPLAQEITAIATNSATQLEPSDVAIADTRVEEPGGARASAYQ